MDWLLIPERAGKKGWFVGLAHFLLPEKYKVSANHT
jgi:hypothetical protein